MIELVAKSSLKFSLSILIHYPDGWLKGSHVYKRSILNDLSGHTEEILPLRSRARAYSDIIL